MRNLQILSVGLYSTNLIEKMEIPKKNKRLIVYVDGFNLYFGMIEANITECKWLNIFALANLIKNISHDIASVKYFTSRVNNNLEKQKRQNTYIDTLLTTPVQIIFGQFRSQKCKCTECGSEYYESKEKMTDVNIATQLLTDAYKNNFDVALLISGDSDLVPPIKSVREIFPEKEIFVAFPPSRESNELKKCANSSFVLGRGKLNQCQFGNPIEDKYGNRLQKPKEWK